MKEEKVCCFTGHRPQRLGYPEDSPQCTALKQKIREILTLLIERRKVAHFISGMARGVDLYAAQIVLDLKKRYPHITLECAIPCAEQTGGWSAYDKEVYARILSVCDKTSLLQVQYTKDCMQKRNRYMVDHADYVLAVWNGIPSGTGNTVKYARTKKVPVILLDPLSLLCRRM